MAIPTNIEEALSNAVFSQGLRRAGAHRSPRGAGHDRDYQTPRPNRSVTLEGLRTFKVRGRRCRNRRIGEFLKELPLTEGQNTGFQKILAALEKNGSPLPEFETDEAHDDFIPRIFVREGFCDAQNSDDPGNGADHFPEAVEALQESYPAKRCKTAARIVAALLENPQSTIARMVADTDISKRTIQRYLSGFQTAGVLRREGSDMSGKWVLREKRRGSACSMRINGLTTA